MWKSLMKYSDQVLLILRLGFGFMFLLYGWPKLFGGAQKWGEFGAAMANLGIHFAPAFWGFMAGFAMVAGAVCLILGVFFRPACVLLLFTMVVAVVFHLRKGDGILGAGHALEDGLVFFALSAIGPGKYSLEHWLKFY